MICHAPGLASWLEIISKVELIRTLGETGQKYWKVEHKGYSFLAVNFLDFQNSVLMIEQESLKDDV